MMRWKCTIKTPSNYLQTVYVEAYTRQDAISTVEHSTGGKCIMSNVDNVGTNDYNDDDDSSSGSNQISGGAMLALAALMFIVFAWKYMLLFGIIAAGIWLIFSAFND